VYVLNNLKAIKILNGIFITKYGVISVMESAYTNERNKKLSKNQENEVRRMIFCENASIYF
jgi:hypothetical protein